MPQVAFSPTFPYKAAQRGRPWSVPRMRLMRSVTGTHNPSGTLPPSDWVSKTEKSTRKLAQQAPQDRQEDSLDMPASYAAKGVLTQRARNL